MTIGADNNFETHKSHGSEVQAFRNEFYDKLKQLTLREAIQFIVARKKKTDAPTIIAILTDIFESQAIGIELVRMDMEQLIFFNFQEKTVQALFVS